MTFYLSIVNDPLVVVMRLELASQFVWDETEQLFFSFTCSENVFYDLQFLCNHVTKDLESSSRLMETPTAIVLGDFLTELPKYVKSSSKHQCMHRHLNNMIFFKKTDQNDH